MSRKSDRLAEKVEELASTLYSTTDMLNTADRMVDHYRGVNREQELEISRLRTELQRPVSPPKGKRRITLRTASKERLHQRPPRSQISDEDSDPEFELEEFEKSLKDLDKKQEKLLRELKRDRKQRTDEMHDIGTTLQKVDENILDRRLSEIKDQLSTGKSKWEQQQSNLSEISEDLKTLKGLIHESHSSKQKEKEESLRNMLRERLQEELSSARHQASSERNDLAEMTRKLEMIQQERQHLTERLNLANEECERKEVTIEKCKSQMQELSTRMKEGELEKRRYMSELEGTISKLKETNRDLELARTELKDSEEKRMDVKNRAIEAIKEYRTKCREQERDKMELMKKTESIQVDLTKVQSENHDLLKEKELSEKRLVENNAKALATSTEQKNEILRLQREIQDLHEELNKKKDLEDRITDLRFQTRESEEEVKSLNRQLQEERSSKATLKQQFEEQFQKIAAEEERLSRQLNEKAVLQQTKYEQEYMALKNQLEEERTKIRDQREVHGHEMLKVKAELDKATENNRRLRRRYQIIRKDLQEKSMEKSSEPRDRNESYTRATELATELHKNQETLLCTREAYQQTLRNIILQLDNLMDLVTDDKEDFYMQGMRESNASDPRKMSNEIMERIKRCRNAFVAIRDEQQSNRQHLRKAQERIQELVQTENYAKDDMALQLTEQKDLITNLELQKRNLEAKLKESNEKVLLITKQLEKSTRVLHAGAEALEDKTSLLEELDDLQFEQKERVKISENYVRYKERIGNLQRALKDAKSSLVGLQEDKADLDDFNTRLEESFQDYLPRPQRVKTARAHPKSFVEPSPKSFQFSPSPIQDDTSDFERNFSPKKRKEKRSSSAKRR